MSAEPLWKRLRMEKWEKHGVSPEDGKVLTKLLQDLAAKKEVRAMKASQKLWTLLRANPSFSGAVRPYLQEIFHISEPAVRDEINDLIELG